MNYIILSLAMQIALISTAAIEKQPWINFWKYPGCDPSAKAEDHFRQYLPPPGTCNGGNINLDPWPKNPAGEFRIWVNGEGIPPDCSVVLRSQIRPEPDKCGDPYIEIRPGRCVETQLSPKSGMNLCCGTDDEVLECIQYYDAPPEKRAGFDPSVTTAVLDTTPATMDLVQRDEECSFEGGEPFDSRGAVQWLTNEIKCTDRKGCEFQREMAVTTSSTNTFEVGTEISTGESLFSLIQASVQFSYSYSYTESRAETIVNVVRYAEGETAVLQWTPYLECVKGTFRGSKCGQWKVESEGTACIPQRINDNPEGQPAGRLQAFILSPEEA